MSLLNFHHLKDEQTIWKFLGQWGRPALQCTDLAVCAGQEMLEAANGGGASGVSSPVDMLC